MTADDLDDMTFVDEDEAPAPPRGTWRILVVDDDDEVHRVTRLALRDFEFDDRRLDIVSALSAAEARAALEAHADITVILLDVVMETDRAGLDFARHVREVVGNRLIRIILRTGQPGQAPERDVVIGYDINDFRAKAELTSQKLFTAMVTALRGYRDMAAIEDKRREMQGLTTALARFVPREFLHSMGRTSITEIGLGDHVQQEMSVLFSDIRGFTGLIEALHPAQAIAFINEYFGHAEPAVIAAGGFVEGYIGDGMMALFPGEADRAVRGAIGMQRALERFNAVRAARGEPALRTGIGVNTGLLMLGTIGGGERIKCGVVGDCVNLAARTEGLCKRYDAGLLITEHTHARLQDPAAYQVRAVARVRVVGRHEPVTLHEVLDAEPPALRAAKLAHAPALAAAMQHYWRGEPGPALAALADCDPRLDRAVETVQERCRQLLAVGVPAGWDGVENLQYK